MGLQTFNSFIRMLLFQLAEAGFYFVGDESEPDVVECFLCQKTLDGWEENDDPWSEHLKHSPNCQFAQLLCPEDALTYYQFLDIKAGLLKMIYKTIADSTEKKLKDKWEDAKKYMSRYLK